MFWWPIDDSDIAPIPIDKYDKAYAEQDDFDVEFIPAPLADELLSVLPDGVTITKREHGFVVHATKDGHYVAEPLLPDACALLALELKERKIISITK